MLEHPVLAMIAHHHNKSVAQVILRWQIQRGVIVIPKSSNPQRIQENSEIFDFHLSDGEMEQIRQLETGTRYSVNPTGIIINPLYVKLMKLFVK
ncbi:aldo/keto reductase [Paenibacillus sp. XY044]|uniref:aldo/keto reductase n=1 Tax=Paenibacillus sp. XY044 TaxID=2026089 RepID=UPI00359C9658